LKEENMIGEIKLVAFTKRLTDHVPCDGRAIYIKENQELFSIIGHEYGKDAPEGMFFVPNAPSVSTEIKLVIQTKGEMPKF
jgi:microcystin-dependent protein